MNKIVKEHYPVSMLPSDLRDAVGAADYVRVTIEDSEERPTPTREQLLKMLEDAQRNAQGITTEEAVSRIRSLRDEWDD